MVSLPQADLSLRLERIGKVLGDILLALFGQSRTEKMTIDDFEHADQASCSRVQDQAQHVAVACLSSSKRRRLRAARTRKRLWQSSTVGSPPGLDIYVAPEQDVSDKAAGTDPGIASLPFKSEDAAQPSDSKSDKLLEYAGD